VKSLITAHHQRNNRIFSGSIYGNGRETQGREGRKENKKHLLRQVLP
jgi:hypothetical protein